MKISKLLLLGLFIALPLAPACDDDDDDGNTSSTATGTDSNSQTTSGTDNNTQTTGGTDNTDPTGSQCTGTDTFTGTTSECEEAKIYEQCLLQACDAQYRQCLGPEFDKGVPGGVCQASLECAIKCGCDTQCQMGCVPDKACQDCFVELGKCQGTSGCQLPDCNGTDTGGGANCTELSACCDSVTDATLKTICTSAAGSGDEATCGAALMSLKSMNLCGG